MPLPLAPIGREYKNLIIVLYWIFGLVMFILIVLFYNCINSRLTLNISRITVLAPVLVPIFSFHRNLSSSKYCSDYVVYLLAWSTLPSYCMVVLFLLDTPGIIWNTTHCHNKPHLLNKTHLIILSKHVFILGHHERFISNLNISGKFNDWHSSSSVDPKQRGTTTSSLCYWLRSIQIILIGGVRVEVWRPYTTGRGKRGQLPA